MRKNKDDDHQVFAKMPQRKNSNSSEHPNTTNTISTLRRSSRLLSNHHTASEAPKTPDPKSKPKRVPQSPSPSSARKASLKNKTHKSFAESKCGSMIFEKSSTGSRRSEALSDPISLRRSPRFSDNELVGKNRNSNQEGKDGKRVTRSSSRGRAGEFVKKSERHECNGFMESASIECFDEEDLESDKLCSNSYKKVGVMINSSGPSLVEEKERDLDKGMKSTGLKRKRNQVEEGHGSVHGWTKDQELALQRAYFAAKPTPNFWKKVAKLVPGKSAQDCFDKVHADQLTPLQPRTRSRMCEKNSPSLLLSPSTLLKSAVSKSKRPSRRKQKGHLVQKTVRQLLQQHYKVDQNYKADLFSVLESMFNPSTQALQQGVILSTPEREQENPSYQKKCRERSSSAHKKHLSRLNSSNGATLVSPPVLKQIKNKALHEKYIDQLHCREAKRKAACARAAKSIPGKENRKDVNIQKMDAIKAAKNALIFDAKDVIHQFQHLKANAMSNCSDFNDDVERDDDEGEYEC